MFEQMLDRWMGEMPLVAILRGVRPEEAPAIGRALTEAGIGLIEVPLNSPDPLRSIAALRAALADSVLVGAGTVTRVDEVSAVRDAGGQLVVMPHAGLPVIRAARDAGLPAVPGFFTPTEGLGAIEAGAQALKCFPAGQMGSAGVAAQRAILPARVPLLPVGGVGLHNLGEFWRAGAAGFGLGSSLYRPGDSADKVGEVAAAFVRAMQALIGERRSGSPVGDTSD